MNYKYVITSGWWCDDNNEDRLEEYGDSYIRDKDFHRMWYEAIRDTGSKAKIYIVDSNSPIKPNLNEREYIISLEENFGHSTKCEYKLSGVSRAHILGMLLALSNGYDYWVYVEQDALIKGEYFIENCIKSMKKPMLFGSGRGTAYPAQQSFMIIKTSYIHKFINRFLNIKSKDNQISPELKFSIASSCILSSIPEFLYRFIEKRGPLNKVARVIVYGIISVFKGYDHVPYGYGRCRPINFEEKHYYFQHGSIDELMNFKNIE